MRRSAVFTIIIAAMTAGLVSVLHARGLLLRPEIWVADLIARFEPTRLVSNRWQYVFVALVALAIAWLTITSTRRSRVIWLVIALVAELFALMWVCGLYRVLFQPLPSLLAAVLSYGAAMIYVSAAGRIRMRLPLAAFHGKLSAEQLARIRSGEVSFDLKARSFEASAIVCDIASKYDFLEAEEPAAIASTSENFKKRASEILLNAGAYLQAADTEGVVGIFGFTDGAADHAEKAVRAAFELIKAFAAPLHGSNGETAPPIAVHVGVSSGSMITAPMPEQHDYFLMGEPVELARRFCVANRFYGSRILIGPRSFELASKTFVARPIDFLSGVSAQERHEIYEPLAPVADAPHDLVARRDYFWNGVVLYREKRWGEAYTEFQKARGPDADEDAPLNLYLRRLEPLTLHLVEMSNQ